MLGYIINHNLLHIFNSLCQLCVHLPFTFSRFIVCTLISTLSSTNLVANLRKPQATHVPIVASKWTIFSTTSMYSYV